MESGPISVSRRIGFKMTQLLVYGHALFVSIRTLEYMTCGDGGFFEERSDGEGLALNWDIVPMMLIGTLFYVIVDINLYFVLDARRELNTKVFNEIVRLRGKPNTTKKCRPYCI